MRVYPDREPNEEPAAVNKMLAATQSSYRSFSDYVAFREDDPAWMIVYKLLLRLLGVVFMIALSPFVLIGLIVAFAAVL